MVISLSYNLGSQMQESEMSFLRRLAALSLRFRVRSPVIKEQLAVEFCSSAEREKFRMLGHLVSSLLMFPLRGVVEVCQLAWEHLSVFPEVLSCGGEECGFGFPGHHHVDHGVR